MKIDKTSWTYSRWCINGNANNFCAEEERRYLKKSNVRYASRKENYEGLYRVVKSRISDSVVRISQPLPMLWYTAPNRELAKADANSVIWRERERERGEELYNQHLHAVAGQQSPNEPTINKKI